MVRVGFWTDQKADLIETMVTSHGAISVRCQSGARTIIVRVLLAIGVVGLKNRWNVLVCPCMRAGWLQCARFLMDLGAHVNDFLAFATIVAPKTTSNSLMCADVGEHAVLWGRLNKPVLCYAPENYASPAHNMR